MLEQEQKEKTTRKWPPFGISRDDVTLRPSAILEACASIVQQRPLHPSSPSLAESIVLKEVSTGCDTMENPHAERQAILLERIVKNAVRRAPHLEFIPSGFTAFLAIVML